MSLTQHVIIIYTKHALINKVLIQVMLLRAV